MNYIITTLNKFGILNMDLGYPVVRASMVIMFLFFGYQKWFPYEATVLIPYISNGPFLSWMYPVFGVTGATYFLGAAEWIFGALLFVGFWNKTAGIIGAIGSCGSFISTVTILPWMPGAWAASAGGFPAMSGTGAFLVKDLVLLAASFYLLEQDLLRFPLANRELTPVTTIAPREPSSSPDTFKRSA
jgi:uncharacterized membrane protein YkgB